MHKRKVIITGAAGNIGRKLRTSLQGQYDLILLDKKRVDDQDFICADLRVYDEQWARCFENSSTVVHLAGNPNTNAGWEELIPDNIDALMNVCHACVERGVDRIIFASSCHTMGGYVDSKTDLITADMPPMPDCDYGASKVVGERILKSFSEWHSLSAICLRIGWVPRASQRPDSKTSEWLRSLWLSEKDLAQIVERAIEVRGIGFEVLYAVSQNKGMKWDLKRTMEVLGYEVGEGRTEGGSHRTWREGHER